LEGYIKNEFDNLTCTPKFKDNTQCDPGFFFNNITCEKCHQNCLECENYEFCLTCKDELMIIIDKNCTCPDEFINVNATCECPLRHFKLNSTCNECLTGCDKCSNISNCTEAAPGFYLDSGTPYPCDKSCFECTGPSSYNCSACAAPQTLNNSVCECPDSQYFNIYECTPCSKNCKKCSQNDFCEECEASYDLDSSKKCSKSVPEEPLTEIFTSLTSTIKYASFAFAYLSASFTSHPSLVWTTINTVQLLCYIPLQNIELPSNLFTFFRSLQPINMIPNLWNALKISQCRSNIVPPFKKYNYICEYFVTNTGEIFVAFIISILYFFLILILFCFSCGKTKSFFLKLIIKYRWSYFIRFWMEAFLDIAIPSVISMNFVMNN